MINRRDFIKFAAASFILPYSEMLSVQNPFFEPNINSSKREYLKREYNFLINPGHSRVPKNFNPGCFLRGVGLECDITQKIGEKTREYLMENNIKAELSKDEGNYLQAINDFKMANKQDLINKVREFEKKKKHNITITVEEAITQLATLGYAKETGFDGVINIHINDLPLERRGMGKGFAVAYSDKNLCKMESKIFCSEMHFSLLESFVPSNNMAEQITEQYGKNMQTISGMMNKPYLVIGSEMYPVQVPSILVECGYIAERYGTLTIGHDSIQDKYACAIANGIISFSKKTRSLLPELLF
jgi:N-acetylmuramoyl-L-alanine amidase